MEIFLRPGIPNYLCPGISCPQGSGIDVSYAMECDYFDVPIFDDKNKQDWMNWRKKWHIVH